MDIDVCLQQAGEFGPAQKRIYYLNGLAARKASPKNNKPRSRVVTEWDLVCLWSYLPKLSQSAYFVGMMFGCWSLGSFAERIGRKKVYFLSIGREWASVMAGWLLQLLCFANLFTWRMIPESPRWLVLKGRVVEAKQLLTWIAKRNGKHLADSTFELKGPGKDLQSRPVSILDLFRGQTICRRTIILSSHWCTVSLVYYALSLSAGDLGGNRYLSFVFSGLVEIPSYVLTIVVLNRWGRRFTNSGSLVAAGVLCLVCAGFVGRGGAELYLVGFSLAGKFAASASFAIAYLYAVELFPTQVRNLGVGVCSLSARIGGIAAPLILLTDKWGAPVPMLVMGTMALVAGSLSSLLPETLNTPLPETLEELDIHSRMTVT
ncbi:hypothetical protein EMCRGX_G032201 [Ephydatia muelleri]